MYLLKSDLSLHLLWNCSWVSQLFEHQYPHTTARYLIWLTVRFHYFYSEFFQLTCIFHVNFILFERYCLILFGRHVSIILSCVSFLPKTSVFRSYITIFLQLATNGFALPLQQNLWFDIETFHYCSTIYITVECFEKISLFVWKFY